jgi:hypothetical protein
LDLLAQLASPGFSAFPLDPKEPSTVLEAAQFLAVLCVALFAGAALYINLVEHPARMSLDTAAAAAQWAPSYHRATLMQAPLAVLSFLAGLAAWLLGAGLSWLIGALLIGAVVPFTFIGIMPTNRRLLGGDLGSSETRQLLIRWNVLHSVRTILSVGALLIMLWQLLEA